MLEFVITENRNITLKAEHMHSRICLIMTVHIVKRYKLEERSKE